MASVTCEADLVALGGDASFPEVPREMVEEQTWHVRMARRWRRREHITSLEAESAVIAVRAICREHAGRGRRHLVLSDSMSWVLCATKGRSSRPGMIARCRELAALSIASNSSFTFRWFSSERNPADEPSSPTGEDRSQTDDEPTTPAEIESENDEASSSFKSKVTKWCARRNRFIQGSVAVDA